MADNIIIIIWNLYLEKKVGDETISRYLYSLNTTSSVYSYVNDMVEYVKGVITFHL